MPSTPQTTVISPARKRIQSDLRQIHRNPPTCLIEIGVVGDDGFHCEAKIRGPPETPYAGGCFRISIRFPPNYPFSPPRFAFITPIYHPSISDAGSVHHPMLRTGGWSVAFDVAQVLDAFTVMLREPSDAEMHPDCVYIARLCVTDWEMFEEFARMMTENHAMD